MRQEDRVGMDSTVVVTTILAKPPQTAPMRIAAQPGTAESGLLPFQSSEGTERPLGRGPIAEPAPSTLAGYRRRPRVDGEPAIRRAALHALADSGAYRSLRPDASGLEWHHPRRSNRRTGPDSE
jgi:hypothetical protein